jgi:hypothetical protein
MPTPTTSADTVHDQAIADPAPSRTLLRTSAGLMFGGVAAAFAVTQLHPAHEAPNDHHAAFAEYAASHSWIMVHLGQFAAGLVIIVGILGLLRALRPGRAPSLLTRAAEMAAVLTASVLAVLQAVDGVALKHAVDSLATVPADLQEAAFHDAEIVRWIEWSMAGYYRIAIGLTMVLVGLAVTRSRILPRWAALFALVSGLAFIADGIDVSNSGFAGTSIWSLGSWAGLILFAAAATAASWWPHRPRAGRARTAADVHS